MWKPCFLSYRKASSRFGPTVPVVPAAASGGWGRGRAAGGGAGRGGGGSGRPRPPPGRPRALPHGGVGGGRRPVGGRITAALARRRSSRLRLGARRERLQLLLRERRE